MNIKNQLLKAKMKIFPNMFSSDDMINYLRGNGINIGKGCRFYRPSSMIIDISRPCQLSIGNYCKITAGVVILAHDYSRSVLRRVYGEVIGEAKHTIIGDNVFIGMNALVLMGANIGNNCIIGAGAVVSGRIPDNSVVAGNPAKVIMTLDEFYSKRKSRYIDEAKQYIVDFNNKYSRFPKENEMLAFWPLFAPRDCNWLRQHNIFTNLGGDEESDVIECFLNSTSTYRDLDELIKSAR